MWNNTFVGQRCNLAYNDTGTIPLTRKLWFLKNNLFDDFNIKSDTFPPFNGSRRGNWSVVNQVGCKGNFLGDFFIGAPSFKAEFVGLNSVQFQPTGSISYLQFVNRTAYTGNETSDNVIGDYNLISTSPAIKMVLSNSIDVLLPYDISGIPRSSPGDAVDAYTYGYVAPAISSPTTTATFIPGTPPSLLSENVDRRNQLREQQMYNEWYIQHLLNEIDIEYRKCYKQKKSLKLINLENDLGCAIARKTILV